MPLEGSTASSNNLILSHCNSYSRRWQPCQISYGKDCNGLQLLAVLPYSRYATSHPMSCMNSLSAYSACPSSSFVPSTTSSSIHYLHSQAPSQRLQAIFHMFVRKSPESFLNGSPISILLTTRQLFDFHQRNCHSSAPMPGKISTATVQAIPFLKETSLHTAKQPMEYTPC